ncbi:hydrophobin precursor protein [Rutstroemia sp. NJR-2017a BVV2]|nr:hydrophobin precursor protein [Rutstroemia sp. NJR-2017a BVV2]
MKTSFVLTLATFLSAAIAMPTATNGGGGGGGGSTPSVFKCPGLTLNTPQCCATDVLGVADLNCAARESLQTPPQSPELP